MSEAPAVPRSRRRLLRRLGILLLNAVLVALIAGLLVATWLPAYVYHHRQMTIGESQAR